ncbi:hypothetical protein [Paenibacillus sp. BJ-4]|nr:hypothetical protein [Paenibacillus sp. BJ-4]
MKWSEENRLHIVGIDATDGYFPILKKGCFQPDYRAVKHPFFDAAF